MLRDPVVTERYRWYRLHLEDFRAIRGLKDDCEFYEAHHRNGGWDQLQESDLGFRVVRNVSPHHSHDCKRTDRTKVR